MGRRRNRRKLIKNVRLTGIADKGKAVGRDEEGMVIFVEDGVPGDLMDVMTLRKKKGVWQARPETLIEKSPDRTEPFCQHFSNCGGCKWQHLNYESQIKHKHQVTIDAFQRIAKVDIGEVLPILGCEKTKFYRNKMVFSFCSKQWIDQEVIDSGVEIDFKPGLGFYRAGAFDKVVDIQECFLQDSVNDKIRNWLRDYAYKNELTFHDPRKHEGMMRNLFLRCNRKGEWMVNIYFHKMEEKVIFPLMKEMQATFPEITSLWYTINPKMNDSTHDLEPIHFGGEKFLLESLDHVQFKISPKSFFQTNTYQAEKLYQIISAFANLEGNENVYDLYTGLGSIALYLANNCKQVVGIEEIEEAIEDAKVNQELNKITNASFYAGDVKDILTPTFAERHGKPDLLITDPPRAGMHEEVVRMLLELESPKIVYISCNPSTQARDIAILKEKYEVLKIQPVDMFPHTHHIENVALLALRHE